MRKRFPFIKLAAFLAAAVVIAVGFPAQARADGTSPGGFARADSGGPAASGNAGAAKCVLRLGGQEVCCHRADAQAVARTAPRGDDNPRLAAGYVNFVPLPLRARIPAPAPSAPPLQTPRFLFGSFRS